MSFILDNTQSDLHERIQRDGGLHIIPESARSIGQGLPVALQLPLKVFVVVVDLKGSQV